MSDIETLGQLADARLEIARLTARLNEAKRLVLELAEWLPKSCDIECSEDAESLSDVKRRIRAALGAL